MPIRPERKALYPRDWKQISQRIRDRDGNQCTFCGAPNGEIIVRDRKGFRVLRGMETEVAFLDGEKTVRIVLTVAHLDHDETNCSEGNLKSLCQSCHLRYDAKQHVSNAAETRRRKKEILGQCSLLDFEN